MDGERESESGRDKDRDSDRRTDRQTDRLTHRQTDRCVCVGVCGCVCVAELLLCSRKFNECTSLYNLTTNPRCMQHLLPARWTECTASGASGMKTYNRAPSTIPSTCVATVCDELACAPQLPVCAGDGRHPSSRAITQRRARARTVTFARQF